MPLIIIPLNEDEVIYYFKNESRTSKLITQTGNSNLGSHLEKLAL